MADTDKFQQQHGEWYLQHLLSNPYRQQQDQAILLVEELEKDNAGERCSELAANYLNMITSLEYYDEEKINRWEKEMRYWKEVKYLCLNWL